MTNKIVQQKLEQKFQFLIEVTVNRIDSVMRSPEGSKERLDWIYNAVYEVGEVKEALKKLKDCRATGEYVPTMQDVATIKTILEKVEVVEIKIRDEFQLIYKGQALYQEHIDLACKFYNFFSRMVANEMLDERRESALRMFSVARSLRAGSVPRQKQKKVKIKRKVLENVPQFEHENRLLRLHREQLETLSERVALQQYRDVFSGRDLQPRSQFRRFRN